MVKQLKRQKKIAKKASILIGLLSVTLFIGHGCSQFDATGSSSSSSSASSIPSTGGDPAGGGFVPLPDTQTVSILYNKVLLDNMVMCAGIGAPSATTQMEWERRQASFSEYGNATDVTAPLLMGVTALGAQICDDALNRETEASVLPANRRFFNSIDFNAGLSGQSISGVSEMVRRIARGCWAREETMEELADINTSIQEGNSLDAIDMTDPTETRKMALSVCTAMISSLAAIVQ